MTPTFLDVLDLFCGRKNVHLGVNGNTVLHFKSTALLIKTQAINRRLRCYVKGTTRTLLHVGPRIRHLSFRRQYVGASVRLSEAIFVAVMGYGLLPSTFQIGSRRKNRFPAERK